MKSFENGFWEPTGNIIKYVWTGGPREEMPVTPLEDVAGWKNAGFTNDVKAGEASFFFYEEELVWVSVDEDPEPELPKEDAETEPGDLEDEEHEEPVDEPEDPGEPELEEEVNPTDIEDIEDIVEQEDAPANHGDGGGEPESEVFEGDGSGNLECPEFYIPGWFNEFGEATSCVNNGSPYVGEDKILIPVEVGDADFVLPELAPEEEIVLKVPVEEAVTIETVSEPVPVLANTGADPFTAGLIGVALLGAGLVTIFRKKISR